MDELGFKKRLVGLAVNVIAGVFEDSEGKGQINGHDQAAGREERNC